MKCPTEKALYIKSPLTNQAKTQSLHINQKEVKKVGTILVKNAIKRKSGYLYYVDGKGNVCEAKMARGGKKKKKK